MRTLVLACCPTGLDGWRGLAKPHFRSQLAGQPQACLTPCTVCCWCRIVARRAVREPVRQCLRRKCAIICKRYVAGVGHLDTSQRCHACLGTCLQLPQRNLGPKTIEQLASKTFDASAPASDSSMCWFVFSTLSAIGSSPARHAFAMWRVELLHPTAAQLLIPWVRPRTGWSGWQRAVLARFFTMPTISEKYCYPQALCTLQQNDRCP